ncbi:MAG: hypothetical protein MIL41_00445 [Hyphomicrobiales bacterium]|jgi:hypothetical protein
MARKHAVGPTDGDPAPPATKTRGRKPRTVKVRPRGVARALGAIAESGQAEALASALGTEPHVFALGFQKGEAVFEIDRRTFDIMNRFIKESPALIGAESTRSTWDCDPDDPYTICW